MFVVFTKQAANMLIKKGFILREIGGNKENIYYFDDSPALQESLKEIMSELDSDFKASRFKNQ